VSESVYQVTFSLAADPAVPEVQTRHARANIADAIWRERLAVVRSEVQDGRVLTYMEVLDAPLRTKDQKALRDRIDRFRKARPEVDLIWLNDSKG